MKILIIDDETEILGLLYNLLYEAFGGPDMTPCNNGAEGLLACMQTPYDLIVTDYKMPIMNGLDFVGILRRCECPNQNTPIIFLSGFVPVIQDSASTFENVHFMDKPVNDKRFLNLISMLCKRPVKRVG